MIPSLKFLFIALEMISQKNAAAEAAAQVEFIDPLEMDPCSHLDLSGSVSKVVV